MTSRVRYTGSTVCRVSCGAALSLFVATTWSSVSRLEAALLTLSTVVLLLLLVWCRSVCLLGLKSVVFVLNSV